MPLTRGTRLGPYEIVTPLGAGGMGEVYRARDTRLNRDVALKILPEAFTQDPERVARFEREAQILAALSHPRIGAIYGFEQAGDARFLVLELVEGESLADRLKRGPLAVDQALTIARQIAEALVEAHEKGIIHRDLKPANVVLTPDEDVKVLDFGLAKLGGPAAATGAPLSMSPTLTTPALMTGVGVILGTAAYMAPEQAKGRDADRRCDVWAFGCVLFEMLSGQQAFAGEDVLDTLTAIIRAEPDWSALPTDVPGHIVTLMQRCLVKDRRLRLADISVVLYVLNEGAAAQAMRPASPVAGRHGRLVLVAAASAAAGIVVTAAAAWLVLRPAPQPPPTVTRFAIVPPPAQPLSLQGIDRDIAISPDGSHIAYRAGSPGRLAIRRMDQLEAQEFDGTLNARQPFFSPDGRWVGFFDGPELKKISVTGGHAVTVSRLRGENPRGASWSDDNTIVFATGDPTTGLLSVPAGGGNPKVLTKPDAARHEIDHLYPEVLPGGRHVLFTVTKGSAENSEIAVLDLKTGQTRSLIRGGTSAEYVETGHLVYAAAGTLSAIRFDPARLNVIGDPVPVVEHVAVAGGGAANFAISRHGTLVYVPGAAGTVSTPRQLVWVDRNGKEQAINAPTRGYAAPRISPDGTRVALQVVDQDHDIWVWDLARETLTRLTFDPGTDEDPVWTPDSRRIIFSSSRTGPLNLFWHAADGTGVDQRLTTSPNAQRPNSMTPDGKYVLGYEVFPETVPDVVRFPIDGKGQSEPVVQTPFAEYNAYISPDGRYVAYQSNESGRFEVYVRPYPNANGGRWQVSTSGGTRPAWARDGHELFYLDLANTLMSVSVQTAAATFAAGNPVKMFDTRYPLNSPFRPYDVSPDGRRFLMIKEGDGGDKAAPTGLVVVEHWFEELKRLVPND